MTPWLWLSNDKLQQQLQKAGDFSISLQTFVSNQQIPSGKRHPDTHPCFLMSPLITWSRWPAFFGRMWKACVFIYLLGTNYKVSSWHFFSVTLVPWYKPYMCKCLRFPDVQSWPGTTSSNSGHYFWRDIRWLKLPQLSRDLTTQRSIRRVVETRSGVCGEAHQPAQPDMALRGCACRLETRSHRDAAQEGKPGWL